MTIGEALEGAMARRGISQPQAAAEIGVSQQQMSKWVRGKERVSKTRVPAVARFLKVSRDEVIAMNGRGGRVDQRLDELDRRVAVLESALLDVENRLRRRSET